LVCTWGKVYRIYRILRNAQNRSRHLPSRSVENNTLHPAMFSWSAQRHCLDRIGPYSLGYYSLLARQLGGKGRNYTQ
jgi:hypothetical protein